MNFIEELVITLMSSSRAIVAIIFGVVFFIVIQLIGNHMANNLHFNGLFAVLDEALKPMILYRYEQVAWGALLSFWMLAAKIVIMERKRIFF